MLQAIETLGDTGGWADQELTREYNLIHNAALNDPHKQCLFQAATTAPTGNLPRELGATYVAVNGVRASLNSVTPDQIVFQIPPVTSPGTASVVAVVGGILSPQRDVLIAGPSSSGNPMVLQIDTPAANSAPFLGTALFSGWAVDTQASIQNLQVMVDSVPVGFAQYGLPRADVCAAYAESINCPGVGWSFALDTTKLSSGPHTLALIASASNGEHVNASVQFTVANWTTATSDPIRISIDTPGENTTLSGVALVGGWALDDISNISGVSLLIDGAPIGDAAYGNNRSDACAMFGAEPGCPNIGWSFLLDTTQLCEWASHPDADRYDRQWPCGEEVRFLCGTELRFSFTEATLQPIIEVKASLHASCLRRSLLVDREGRYYRYTHAAASCRSR